VSCDPSLSVNDRIVGGERRYVQLPDEPIGRAAVSVRVGLLRWHGGRVGRYAE
jgi:hypothetical protein